MLFPSARPLVDDDDAPYRWSERLSSSRREWLTYERLIDAALWITTAALVFITLLFSFGIAAPGAGRTSLADEAGHAAIQFATTLFLLLAAVWRPGRGDGRFPTLTTAIPIAVIGASIVIEVLQEVTTRSRHAELGDVVAEAVGASGALAAHALLRRRQEARTS
jgi:hypothetical protein